MEDLVVRPGLVIPAKLLEWSASRSGGPGGQNVNKVSSKVDLRFSLGAWSVLHPDARGRLAALAANRFDEHGRIQIVVQDTRDQAMNLALARERLVALIVASLVVPKVRRPTKPTRGSTRRRLDAKKATSEKKRSRGKFDEG